MKNTLLKKLIIRNRNRIKCHHFLYPTNTTNMASYFLIFIFLLSSSKISVNHKCFFEILKLFIKWIEKFHDIIKICIFLYFYFLIFFFLRKIKSNTVERVDLYSTSRFTQDSFFHVDIYAKIL